LPKEKQYLIAGKPADTEDAYDTVTPADINAPVSFDFGATLLNTNKGLMAQALQGLGQALFNPLAAQMGLFGPEQYFNWMQDLTNSNQLDPTRYTKRPPGMPEGPPITANDAITALLNGMHPGLNFIEGPEAAFQTMMDWMQSDQFGLLSQSNMGLFKAYMITPQQAVQAVQQQQAMAQAAQQFQQQAGQQGQGQAGAPGGPATTPPAQSQPASQAEIRGGGQQGPPGSAGPIR
jgi:hypothetical protein